MKTMKWILLLFTAPAWVYAGNGTEGAAFLEIPVGARAAALGSAYSALAADAYAPIWNPAGLGFLSSPEVTAQHLSYLDTIYYEHVGFVMPVRKGTIHPGGLGFSAQYLGSGTTDATDPNGSTVGTFKSHYAAYSLAYGQQLSPHLSMGVTGKIIEAKIAMMAMTVNNSIRLNAARREDIMKKLPD